MRVARRSLRRDQTRSKIRERVQQRTQELNEEFGLDPKVKHTLLYDVDFSQEELKTAYAEDAREATKTMTK
jgi:hypothetical protein